MADIERRGYGRFSADVDGEFFAGGRQTAGLVTLTDLSRSGFRAFLNQPVRLADTLECELRFPHSIMTFSVRGRVCWVQSAEDRCCAGVRFEYIDPYDRERLIDFYYRQHSAPPVKDQPLDL